MPSKHLVLEAEVSSAESWEVKTDVKWGDQGQTEKGENKLELASISHSSFLVTRRMMMLQQIKDEQALASY